MTYHKDTSEKNERTRGGVPEAQLVAEVIRAQHVGTRGPVELRHRRRVAGALRGGREARRRMVDVDHGVGAPRSAQEATLYQLCLAGPAEG